MKVENKERTRTISNPDPKLIQTTMQRVIIDKLSRSTNKNDLVEVWKKYSDELTGCYGLFALNDGFALNIPKEKTFNKKGFLYSFLGNENIIPISNEVLSTGKYEYTYTISSDTNFISYIDSLARKGVAGNLTSEVLDILKYIKVNGYQVGLDPTFYFFENFDEIKKRSSYCMSTLNSYFKYLSSDTDKLVNLNKIVTNESDDEINKRVLDALSDYNIKRFDVMYKWVERNYNISLILLQKILIIEHTFFKIHPKDKLIKLMDFVNDELCFFPLNELIVTYYYYESKRNNLFFRKLKINSKKLFATLKGMAWDLSHIRTLLDFIPSIINLSKLAPFSIPFIVTFDKGLFEQLSLIKCKAIIYDTRKRKTYTIPLQDINSLLMDLVGKDNMEKFFTSDSIVEREKRKSAITDEYAHLESIVDSLNKELSQFV